MASTAGGKYVFFELNPYGQFLSLEVDDVSLPASTALAEALMAPALVGLMSHSA
jgi:hypothetical protein